MGGRVLGVDVGERRVGLAISDASRTLARPLITIDVTGAANAVERVMKAIRCHEFGSPDILGLDEFAAPAALQPEQARIRVHAAGINFADTLMVAGKYQIKPPFPFTPGLEVCGEVIEVGAAVQRLRPDQRIYVLRSRSEIAAFEAELSTLREAA